MRQFIIIFGLLTGYLAHAQEEHHAEAEYKNFVQRAESPSKNVQEKYICEKNDREIREEIDRALNELRYPKQSYLYKKLSKLNQPDVDQAVALAMRSMVNQYDRSCFPNGEIPADLCPKIQGLEISEKNGKKIIDVDSEMEMELQVQNKARVWVLKHKKTGENLGFISDRNADGFYDNISLSGELERREDTKEKTSFGLSWKRREVSYGFSAMHTLDLQTPVYSQYFNTLSDGEKCASEFGNPLKLFRDFANKEKWTADKVLLTKGKLRAIALEGAREGARNGFIDSVMRIRHGAGMTAKTLYGIAKFLVKPSTYATIAKAINRTIGPEALRDCEKKYGRGNISVFECIEEKVSLAAASGMDKTAKVAVAAWEGIKSKTKECFTVSGNEEKFAECMGDIAFLSLSSATGTTLARNGAQLAEGANRASRAVGKAAKVTGEWVVDQVGFSSAGVKDPLQKWTQANNRLLSDLRGASVNVRTNKEAWDYAQKVRHSRSLHGPLGYENEKVRLVWPEIKKSLDEINPNAQAYDMPIPQEYGGGFLKVLPRHQPGDPKIAQALKVKADAAASSVKKSKAEIIEHTFDDATRESAEIFSSDMKQRLLALAKVSKNPREQVSQILESTNLEHLIKIEDVALARQAGRYERAMDRAKKLESSGSTRDVARANRLRTAAKKDGIAFGNGPHVREVYGAIDRDSFSQVMRAIDPALSPGQLEHLYQFQKTLVAVHDLGKNFPSPTVLKMAETLGKDKAFVAGRIGMHDLSSAGEIRALSALNHIDDSTRDLLTRHIMGHNDGSGLPDVWWNRFGRSGLTSDHVPDTVFSKLLAMADRGGQATLGPSGGVLKITNQRMVGASPAQFGPELLEETMLRNSQNTLRQMGEIAKDFKRDFGVDLSDVPAVEKLFQGPRRTLEAYRSIVWIMRPSVDKPRFLGVLAGKTFETKDEFFSLLNSIEDKIQLGTLSSDYYSQAHQAYLATINAVNKAAGK